MRRGDAFDMDRRQRVKGISNLSEFGEHGLGVAAAQQRARVAALDAVSEDFGDGMKPYRYCLIEDQLARLLLEEGTAAGCDHLGRAVEQPGDDAAFAVAEIGLAETIEDVVRDFVESRPYTTAAIALGIGWLIGTMGRRRYG